MVQRIRSEFQRIRTGEGGGERMSQAELDAYRRQLVLLAVTVTTVALILILGIGAYYQYVHLPRQAVATVNGDTIRRSEYWDFRQYELLNQINQYQQFGQMMEGQQAEQYQQLAFEANQEFEDIEDASIDPVTVNEMINNKILLDALDEFGLEITEEEIDDRLVEFFTGMPISDEETGPSADPTAEAWATATAEAEEEEAEEAESEAEEDADADEPADDEDTESSESESGTDEENGADDGESEDTSSDESGDGEDDAEFQDADSDDVEVEEDLESDEAENGDSDGSDEQSDEAEGDEEDSDEDAEATPTPEPTPSEEDIRATAEATEADHQEFLLDRAGISHDEFVDMFIRPQIAREKIRNHLAEDVPTRGEQVQAAHILVATEDAAQVVYDDLTEGDADFAEVAEEESTDQQTAPNGGDLGWFPRGVMVDEFEEVIFELDAGEISEPFETEFGWHIATVTEREEDRPIPISVLEQLRQQEFDEWLEEQREAADIDTEYDLPDQDEQTQNQFQPPATAPQPPQPEMDPGADMQQEIPIGNEDESESEDVFDGEDPFEDAEDGEDDD